MDYNEYQTIIQSGVDPDHLTTFYLRDYGPGFPRTASTRQRDRARDPGL